MQYNSEIDKIGSVRNAGSGDSTTLNSSFIHKDQSITKNSNEVPGLKRVKSVIINHKNEEIEVNTDNEQDVYKGKVVADLPAQWVEGGKSDTMQVLYGQEVDKKFFEDWKQLPPKTGGIFPASGIAFMDYLGILNPAATVPIRKEIFVKSNKR